MNEEYTVDELTEILDDFIKSDHVNIRVKLARHGYRLDKLVTDESTYIRAAVARQGY